MKKIGIRKNLSMWRDGTVPLLLAVTLLISPALLRAQDDFDLDSLLQGLLEQAGAADPQPAAETPAEPPQEVRLDDLQAEPAAEQPPPVDAELVEEAAAAVKELRDEQAQQEAGAPVADPLAEDAETQVTPEPEELDINERVRRQELELSAQYLVIQAQQAYRRGEFREAAKLYLEAEGKLREASKSEERVLRRVNEIRTALYNLNKDWAETEAAEAKKLANAEKFDEAIQRAHTAAEYDPSKRADMDRLIKVFMEQKKQVEYQELIAPKHVDLDQYERDFRINVLYEQSRIFLRNRRYADARDRLEQILLENPYEVRAIRGLRQLNDLLLEHAAEKRLSTIAERLAEVRWKWNEPVTPLVAGASPGTETAAVRKVDEDRGIRAKLSNIIIPRVDFEEATVAQVIQFLQRRSKELDPDGEGVNMFLRLDSGGGGAAPAAAPAAAAPAADDGFGDFGDFGDFDAGADAGGFGAPAAAAPAAVAPAGGGGSRTVTMQMDNMPLGEILRYVSMGAGLKFRVETNAVIIADESVALDEMETRYYSVEAGVLAAPPTRSADTSIGEASWGGGGGGGGGGGAEAPSTDLKTFFGDFGVSFPNESRISYYAPTGRLVHHNTPENLRKLEKSLQEINTRPTQVTIEAKFVEVVQNELETLGFEWLVMEGDGNFNDGIVLGSGNNKAQILKQGSGLNSPLFAPKITNAIRFAHQFFEDVPQGSDAILSINSILGGTSFNTIIHALNQRGNADVLSAPKVTTLSGNTAILKMVEKRYIATRWSEPTVTAASDNVGGSFTPSIPETEEMEFGVVLEVTPTVAADMYSIDLELMPKVLDFIRYDDSFNYKMVVNGEEVEAKALTPVMAERSVETKVIVWDGETVVLGGMIRERVSRWNDKVPLFGDIPLIGRMFRTTGEKSEKINLLIFVTARLVNPAGLPIRANEIRGLPDFRH